MTGLWLVSYIALWALFLIVAFALVSVLRNLGVIYDSMATLWSRPTTKLIAGQALPELTLHTLAGDPMSLSEFWGVKTAFLIVNPDCSPCQDLLKIIAKGNTNPDPLDPTVQRKVVISVGEALRTAEMVRQASLYQNHQHILVDTESAVAEKWGINSAPITVIVDEQLRVVRQVFGGHVDTPR